MFKYCSNCHILTLFMKKFENLPSKDYKYLNLFKIMDECLSEIKEL